MLAGFANDKVMTREGRLRYHGGMYHGGMYHVHKAL